MNLKINEAILRLWAESFADQTISPFALKSHQMWLSSTRKHSAAIWDKEIDMARSGFAPLYDGTSDNYSREGKPLLGYGPRTQLMRQAGI